MGRLESWLRPVIQARQDVVIAVNRVGTDLDQACRIPISGLAVVQVCECECKRCVETDDAEFALIRRITTLAPDARRKSRPTSR